MSQSFVIFKVSWLTKREGEEHRTKEIIEHFYHIMQFLQSNSLTVQPMISSRKDLTDEFTLSSSDLTAEGLALIKAAYHKWLSKVDKGMSPENTTILSKALEKIRELR